MSTGYINQYLSRMYKCITSDPRLRTDYLALFIIYNKRVYHKGKRLIHWYWTHLFKKLGLIFKDKPKAKHL